jgi:hypothetical protein
MMTNIMRKGNSPQSEVSKTAPKVQTALTRLLSGGK